MSKFLYYILTLNAKKVSSIYALFNKASGKLSFIKCTSHPAHLLSVIILCEKLFSYDRIKNTYVHKHVELPRNCRLYIHYSQQLISVIHLRIEAMSLYTNKKWKFQRETERKKNYLQILQHESFMSVRNL